MATIAQLNRMHCEYDADYLKTCADLYVGGRQFQRNVSRYLVKNDVEADSTWQRRQRAAHYLNYVGPICGAFAAQLFSVPPALKSDPDDVEEWWSQWKASCDGQGTDLDSFLRDRYLEALQHRRSYWLIEWPSVALPAAPSRADYDQAGAGDATLRAIPTASVINWRRDNAGALLWALVYEREQQLLEIDDPDETLTETWTLYRSDGTARRWQRVSGAKSQKPATETFVAEIEAPRNPTGVSAIVCLELPSALWILNLLAQPQIESFRKRCALSWAIDRTCYAMPVAKLKDVKKPPTMGSGYYLILGPDDSLDWAAPPSQSYDVVSNYLSSLKDEIYRVTHQMAAGVDNNAAAIGRSGDSKEADGAATRVVLAAMGAPVREAAQRTLDSLSLGRAERVAWTVTGLDRYDDAPDAAAMIQLAVESEVLKIPSLTLRKELQKQAANALLADADEATKATVRDEIEKGLDAELTPPLAMGTDAATGDGNVPIVSAVVSGAETVADTAFNGAQGQTYLDFGRAVSAREIPRGMGVKALMRLFQMSAEEADDAMDEAGKSFEPAADTAAK